MKNMKNVNERKVNRFSIRKLSIGAASVLLSTTVYFGLKLQEPTVQAAQVTSTVSQNNEVESTSDKKVETEKTNSVASSAQQKTIEGAKKATSDENTTINNVKENATTTATNPSAQVIYPNTGDSIQAGSWFKVKVSSGDLTNVKKGSTYQVTVGNSLPLNYDRSEFSTPDFEVANMGNGTYNLTANNNYSKASFDITVSMSYNQTLTSDKTISMPITFSYDGQTKALSTELNLVPAPKPTYEETHPLLKYVCYGLNPLTNTISWGIYVNYNATDLRDVDIEGTFSGAQEVLKNSIMAYNTFPGDSGDLHVTEHQYQQYNYSLSKLMQDESTPKSIELKQAGPFIVDGVDYSKKPLYIYFQTQLVDSNTPDPGSAKPADYASELSLKAAGISIKESESPAPTGNNGNSMGENNLVPVSESRTVTETINYLYADTNEIAAPQYKAQPLTFTRTGKKNTVTGEVSWNSWTSEQSFKAVTSPVIDGYNVDKQEIANQIVNYNSKDFVFNVYYTKTEVPVIPQQPIVPDPTPIPQPHPQPVPTPEPTPDVPQPHDSVTSDVPQPHASVISENIPKKAVENVPSEVQKDIVVAPHASLNNENVRTTVKRQTKESLPQTGSRKDSLSLMGLSISLIAAIISLLGFRQKKN